MRFDAVGEGWTIGLDKKHEAWPIPYQHTRIGPEEPCSDLALEGYRKTEGCVGTCMRELNLFERVRKSPQTGLRSVR